MQKTIISGLIICAANLTGCATYPGLFYTEHAQFGLQVKVNPRENKPVDVNMGYDRGTFAVVPRAGKGQEAVSVISKNDICVRFAESTAVRNLYASGEAAKRIALKTDSMKAFTTLKDTVKAASPSENSKCE